MGFAEEEIVNKNVKSVLLCTNEISFVCFFPCSVTIIVTRAPL